MRGTLANRTAPTWLGLAALALCIVWGVSAAEAQTSSPQPNVLFILTDDQMPSTLEHMPNYQQLASEGRVFENTVNVYPLCCPSRAVLQRGQYAHNTGIVQNTGSPDGGWEGFKHRGLHRDTVATWLDGDYETAYFGKYLNNYRDIEAPPGWDRWNALSGGGMGWSSIVDGKSRKQISPVQADGIVKKRALSFLREDHAAPFFAYVSFAAPHDPYQYPKAHAGRYKGLRAPRTPGWNEADVSDKPRHIRGRDQFDGEQVKALDEEYRDALRSLIRVDQFIGQAAATVPDDTYVVFYTDNGVHTGYHRMGYGKRTPYEEDMVFPMTIKGPGVEQGRTDKLVGSHDVVPTIADLAGIAPPGFVDGRSIRPLLSGNPATWRDAVLSENVADPTGKSNIPSWEAVRTETHTYVEYDTGERELYDLEADASQENNLLRPGGSGNPGDLPEKLDDLRGCTPTSVPTCREAEGQ